jgi:hypothetical protein
MKGQRTYLECKNSIGMRCYNKVFDSKNEAKQRGVLLVKSGKIDSYTLVRIPDTREFEAKLESWDWRINEIEFDNGILIAEIEQFTDGGVDYVMYVELNEGAYRQSVENIDPSNEAIDYWRSDETYRAAFGNISDAYLDLANFKERLLEQLKEI